MMKAHQAPGVVPFGAMTRSAVARGSVAYADPLQA
jgi:hypothetical protein